MNREPREAQRLIMGPLVRTRREKDEERGEKKGEDENEEIEELD